MWIVTDAAGAVVAGPAETPPEAGQGQTLRRVPLGTAWNANRQAFVDASPSISKFQYVLLWPPAADLLVRQSTDPQMARARSLFEAWEGPINLTEPLVIAGIDRAQALGLLTEAQALRIKAGLPPEEPGNG